MRVLHAEVSFATFLYSSLVTYLNKYSLPWNKNARSTPQVCEFSAFSILSISNHAPTANSALLASL